VCVRVYKFYTPSTFNLKILHVYFLKHVYIPSNKSADLKIYYIFVTSIRIFPLMFLCNNQLIKKKSEL
jgi:hypothetical protein